MIAVEDLAPVLPGMPISLDVLRNDRGFVCDNDNVTITATAPLSFTDLGGEIEIVDTAPDGSDVKPFIRYTAPCVTVGVDTFDYTIESTNPAAPDDLSSTATVRLVLVGPKDYPDVPQVIEAQSEGIASYGSSGDPQNVNSTFAFVEYYIFDP